MPRLLARIPVSSGRVTNLPDVIRRRGATYLLGREDATSTSALMTAGVSGDGPAPSSCFVACAWYGGLDRKGLKERRVAGGD